MSHLGFPHCTLTPGSIRGSSTITLAPAEPQKTAPPLIRWRSHVNFLLLIVALTSYLLFGALIFGVIEAGDEVRMWREIQSLAHAIKRDYGACGGNGRAMSD